MATPARCTTNTSCTHTDRTKKAHVCPCSTRAHSRIALRCVSGPHAGTPQPINPRGGRDPQGAPLKTARPQTARLAAKRTSKSEAGGARLWAQMPRAIPRALPRLGPHRGGGAVTTFQARRECPGGRHKRGERASRPVGCTGRAAGRVPPNCPPLPPCAPRARRRLCRSAAQHRPESHIRAHRRARRTLSAVISLSGSGSERRADGALRSGKRAPAAPRPGPSAPPPRRGGGGGEGGARDPPRPLAGRAARPRARGSAGRSRRPCPGEYRRELRSSLFCPSEVGKGPPSGTED